MVTEILKVVLDCDDEIEPENQDRFEVQGCMFWQSVFAETNENLSEYGDIPCDVEKLFRANVAKYNVLNDNEFDYYGVEIDEAGTVFTIKCRLKNR